MSKADWWKTMFDQKYLDTYLDRFTIERTRAEVDFIIKTAELEYDDVILDLACGHGRHSIELAIRGFSHVTGLDYSETFIAKAKKDAIEAGVNVDFILGDMKDLHFDARFDVVLLLFTAFGYFDDSTNKMVLRQVNNSLKPGGRLCIDVISAEAVQKRFNNEGIVDGVTGQLKIARQVNMGDNMVNETEIYDEDSQVLHNHREWQVRGQKKEYEYWLHVYTREQYQDMLTKAGFHNILVGSQNDTKHRTLVLAQKAK